MRPIFVFIKCEPGYTYKVAERLMIELADEAPKLYSISGDYDLLAHFYDLEPDIDLGRFVCERVQAVDHIRDTKTLICFNALSGSKWEL